MAIKNSVSNNFLSTFVKSIYVFDCRLSSVISLLRIIPYIKTNNRVKFQIFFIYFTFKTQANTVRHDQTFTGCVMLFIRLQCKT